MSKKVKAKHNIEKASHRKAMSDLIKQRDCINCGRWALLAKSVYEDTGELCSAESCPNAIENRVDYEDVDESVDIDETLSFEVTMMDFEALYADYAESEALNEKSEDSPASLTTRTST